MGAMLKWMQTHSGSVMKYLIWSAAIMGMYYLVRLGAKHAKDEQELMEKDDDRNERDRPPGGDR